MKTVLIVDDDLDLAETLIERFKKEGWIAQTTVGGLSAIQKIEKEKFDLIISDIRMPNGTGIELLRKLRKNEDKKVNQIPIIIMTGLLEGGESYLKALGARGIFLKTNPLDGLIQMAKQLMAAQ
jgi:CheY-like chemotaxis protein